MGTGTVGGRMVNAEKTAAAMVSAAVDYLENGAFGNSYDVLEYCIDYDAAKKHSLDVSRLPKGTVVFNKPVSYFMKNYDKMMFITNIFIVFLMAATIIVLINVYIANKKLAQTNKQLEDAKRSADSVSRTDTLTGLFNRRGAESFIMYEQKRAERHGVPVSLAVFDIDNFKT